MRRRWRSAWAHSVVAVGWALAFSACSPSGSESPDSGAVEIAAAAAEQVTPLFSYRVVKVFPHDSGAFTQGLDYHEGALYEGTGLHGRSTLRRVELESGRVLQSQPLARRYFGEGIAVLDDRIYQLTWQEKTGFVYDRESFALLKRFSYEGEGWGITHDGSRLIVSDGSANLYFWDPETLEEIGRVEVNDHQGPVTQLNELEYIKGEVWANVWKSERIARIDPASGEVLAWIELSGLLTPADLRRQVDVLNGIAYDPEGDRIFVTGKLWPKLFQIELVATQ